METYFKYLRGAVRQAVVMAESRGYKVDENHLALHFDFGGVSYETTKSASIRLFTERGNEAKKMLHISIYRMPSGTYELTSYLN
jgi:hypothetical protein